MGRYDRLYESIRNEDRIALIADYAISAIRTAPGHRQLRNPAAIARMADCIRSDNLAEVLREKILIGIFAHEVSGEVELSSVECLDGNHRLVAGLASGRWRTLADIPIGAIDTRVNGWRADGGASERRWIPREVAERSALEPESYESVDHPDARGETVSIPGEISSLDSRFAEPDRGVTMGELWRALAGRPGA